MQVAANGLTFEVEMHGSQGGIPLLLIMGLGMQLTAWPEELLTSLVDKGFRPITFDNRDIGLSSRMDARGMPNLVAAGIRHALGWKIRAPYLIADMADDVAGLLDALRISSCHVVGVSMGGMIAQHLAAAYAARVRSLALIMTSSGARHLPGPTVRARRALLSRPRDTKTVEGRVEHGIKIWRVIGSPGFPVSEAMLRTKVERSVRRSYYPPGVARQLVAIAASGDRSHMLSGIHAPTLVMHGREDPLVPLACGLDLARKIRDARLEVLDGMGHDLPPALLPHIAELIAANAARATP